MFKVEDYITHVDFPEDLPYLVKDFMGSKLPDVNIRLFHSSPSYKSIVRIAANYVGKLAGTTMVGYKKPHGMSGANAGIPWNIIALVENRNTEHESILIMINPKIVKYIGNDIVTNTNCGSIRLKDPIEVIRSEAVEVEYYDLFGKKIVKEFTRNEGSFTIQHEVDHNNGILITDRKT